MQISVLARGVKNSDRFENYVDQKADKVTQLSDRAQRFEVKVSNISDKTPDLGERVELTVIAPGPVIRAEAEGGDRFSAFDQALGKLSERLRRSKDRRKISKGRPNRVQVSVDAGVVVPDASAATDAGVDEQPESPLVIRRKEFPAERLSPEQAVDRMELVGHDFYLFEDVETGKSSVVYRRKGYNYGVIALGEAGETVDE
ncbi:ribosome-associated translation inhibitor RaiA [Pseudoclavibacter sp. CFCC 13796]|uniref:ribosome hibernation-promoting factor, HPF/YfiA family n=1 Tax=Pseudoclavibacter sp. CFCC 13796 TaxID=2615179 RepID=UPI001300F393|nr:ribosome-associated translation inhibitor RaiA [Pseudoclavibacter sp. CFCC 13796]KAB1661241.1 ribosome-associated translation inhibitor RaiA [Pseudoclavibacter sp. CFCC 13796]